MRIINAIDSSDKHYEFCPLDTTLSVLSGKWKTIIICRLMSNPLYFTELKNKIPNCTKRMLAIQLTQLEEDGIVIKSVSSSYSPFHVQYYLTEIGVSLVPIINSMDSWGSQYIEKLETLKNN